MESYINIESILKYSPTQLQPISQSQLKSQSEISSWDTSNINTNDDPNNDPNINHSDNLNDKPDSLENLMHEKVNCLSTILNQINQEIHKRKELSENVIYRIYQNYCYVKTELFALYKFDFKINRSVEIRLSNVEAHLNRLKNEKRQEQVKCFTDTALLKKEFRQWFKQYSDILQRTKLILDS